jgi:hypothetical protein
VVDEVALEQIYSEFFGFPLSVSFLQCAMFVFYTSTTDAM